MRVLYKKDDSGVVAIEPDGFEPSPLELEQLNIIDIDGNYLAESDKLKMCILSPKYKTYTVSRRVNGRVSRSVRQTEEIISSSGYYIDTKADTQTNQLRRRK